MTLITLIRDTLVDLEKAYADKSITEHEYKLAKALLTEDLASETHLQELIRNR